MYRELLNEFTKIAQEVDTDELESIAAEILTELYGPNGERLFGEKTAEEELEDVYSKEASDLSFDPYEEGLESLAAEKDPRLFGVDRNIFTGERKVEFLPDMSESEKDDLMESALNDGAPLAVGGAALAGGAYLAGKGLYRGGKAIVNAVKGLKKSAEESPEEEKTAFLGTALGIGLGVGGLFAGQKIKERMDEVKEWKAGYERSKLNPALLADMQSAQQGADEMAKAYKHNLVGQSMMRSARRRADAVSAQYGMPSFAEKKDKNKGAGVSNKKIPTKLKSSVGAGKAPAAKGILGTGIPLNGATLAVGALGAYGLSQAMKARDIDNENKGLRTPRG